MRDRRELPYQNLWEPLPKHNEIAEITEQAEQVLGDVSRFMSDAERFTEEIATGTLPKWKIMGRAISLNFRRRVLNSRLQKTQERQQKLMDQWATIRKQTRNLSGDARNPRTKRPEKADYEPPVQASPWLWHSFRWKWEMRGGFGGKHFWSA